jgi:hypothetical protein
VHCSLTTSPSSWRHDRKKRRSACWKCIFQVFQRYVASVAYGYWKSRSGCCTCYNSYTRMLQAFVQSVSSIFQTYHVCCKCFIWVLHMFSHKCCKRLFEMFHSFHMHVASVLSWCHICFTQMLYAFVPNISYVSDICSNKFFLVLQVFSCFKRNRTARVTWHISVGGGASAIRSKRRHRRSLRARYRAGHWQSPLARGSQSGSV